MQIMNRFSLIYAKSLVDLVVLLNQSAHVASRVIYFGENKGQSESFPDLDILNDAPFIAVLDLSPTVVVLAEDIEVLSSDTDVLVDLEDDSASESDKYRKVDTV